MYLLNRDDHLLRHLLHRLVRLDNPLYHTVYTPYALQESFAMGEYFLLGQYTALIGFWVMVSGSCSRRRENDDGREEVGEDRYVSAVKQMSVAGRLSFCQFTFLHAHLAAAADDEVWAGKSGRCMYGYGVSSSIYLYMRMLWYYCV